MANGGTSTRASRSGVIRRTDTARATPDAIDAPPIGGSRERFWLYGTALVLAGCTIIIGGVQSDFGDWPGYVRAGQTAGTPALLHPPRGVFPFLYLPAFAWLFVPFAHTAMASGYVVNAVAMAACGAAAAALMAATYRLRRGPALLMTFAWSPTIYSIAIGQSSNLGLLLAAASTAGLARGSVVLAAVPAALLLFKPTYAIPLLLVMLVRNRLRELGLAAIVGSALYAASTAAAAGDWGWPAVWLAAVSAWLPIDNAHSAAKVISTMTLLIRAGAPAAAIAVIIVLALAVVTPLLRRLAIAEASALAMAAGLVLSAHALTYEAVMLLPLIFVAATTLREPHRTRILGVTYVLAACAPYADIIRVNTLLVIVPLAAVGWLFVRYRRNGAVRAIGGDTSG